MLRSSSPVSLARGNLLEFLLLTSRDIKLNSARKQAVLGALRYHSPELVPVLALFLAYILFIAPYSSDKWRVTAELAMAFLSVGTVLRFIYSVATGKRAGHTVKDEKTDRGA